MKVEMGESLFYSWLRHHDDKQCQVVQTNWKRSSSWELQNEHELKQFMNATYEHFQFKKILLSQLLKQAEIDVVGICMSERVVKKIYAIDVAFHESGFLYVNRKETVTRVIKKCIRTALCLHGYFNTREGEIIFASPKIGKSIMDDLELCIADLNSLFQGNGYYFTAKVIANDEFNKDVLTPMLEASSGVSDTTELFMRGFQLVSMFKKSVDRPAKPSKTATDSQ